MQQVDLKYVIIGQLVEQNTTLLGQIQQLNSELAAVRAEIEHLKTPPAMPEVVLPADVE